MCCFSLAYLRCHVEIRGNSGWQYIDANRKEPVQMVNCPLPGLLLFVGNRYIVKVR